MPWEPTIPAGCILPLAKPFKEIKYYKPQVFQAPLFSLFLQDGFRSG